MFDICLFDLDETLLRTADLKEIRESGKNINTDEYAKAVLGKLNSGMDRRIYSLDLLKQIRLKFPNMKLGIFTRSPRSYATAALAWAYHGFEWDVVVAFEDVKPTKPYGNGIDLVMDKFGILHTDNLPRVILVGDGDVDVRAAYNCGCVVAVDKSAWPKKFESEHWGAIGHVPDAIIESPADIIDLLANPSDFLPALERELSGIAAPRKLVRFDKLGHFVPEAAGGDKRTSFQIFVAGRSFANYDSIKFRKAWHVLTKSIEDNKDSEEFPVEWVNTIRTFISTNYQTFFGPERVIVSVVPHRPGRAPRLENLLAQLASSIVAKPIGRLTVICEPKLLAYKEGVKSQHNDHLTAIERFINVRDHLTVQQPEFIRPGTSFLIIDDVVTTGASLIFSQQYLRAAGAADVKLLSMAKNIGNLYK
jgi:beta-phosphoglucomutase-like phosphatase (HAD superfamily)